MTGRGRGRGALARWGPSPGPAFGGGLDGRAIASVPPLKKEISSQASVSHGGTERRASCVRVTCIIDVNHFWAQLGSAAELDHFDHYMFALNQWCESRPPASLSEMPVVGQVVCVRHTSTGRWRRAEVTRLSQRMVDVFFLDFGEAECVPVKLLCNGTPSDVTAWPPQALYCTLEGVQPAHGEDQWSESAVKRFRELIGCGPRLVAYHEAGSFQLALFIRDDHGNETSVSLILAEEGLAQGITAAGTPSDDSIWREELARERPPAVKEIDKPLSREKLKELEKLEQQLVMSGFTYLIPPSHESDQSQQTKDHGFGSTTTISSTFFQYKEKISDIHHGILGNKDEHNQGHFLPSASHFQSSLKHFVTPVSLPQTSSQTISSSNVMSGFGSSCARDGSRGHGAGILGSPHVVARPHLASPGEFMASSKGTGPSSGKCHEPVLPPSEEEKPGRYVPPPLRMQQKEEANSEVAAPETGIDQPAEWYRNSSLVSNAWSPSEQQTNKDHENQWFPKEDSTKESIPHRMEQGYKWEQEPQYQNDDRMQQSNPAETSQQQDIASAFQQHLHGASAFHGPKFGKTSLAAMFTAPVKGEQSETTQMQSYAYQQQQPAVRQQFKHFEPLKVQPLQENNNDKAMKKELEWQKWKFQRNVKRILDKATLENAEDLGCDLGRVVAESRLSQNFEGVSEVLVVLDMVMEKVLDKKGFAGIASTLFLVLSGLGVTKFVERFSDVVLAFRDDLIEQHTISDWESRCHRFCSFLGEMFLADTEEDVASGFQSVVASIIRQSLEKWSTLEQNESENELDVDVVCLASLLKCIGPVVEDSKKSVDGIDVDQMFSTVIRNHVLSTDLPRSVRSILLDLMLSRASGWPEEKEADTPGDSCTDVNQEVITEPDDNDVDETQDNKGQEEEEPPRWDTGADELGSDGDEWDPYARVTAMLHQLKLEDLFPNFRDNCIRDSLLSANKEEFKKTLQEAGFPPGVILEIRMFLDKGNFSLKAKPSSDKPPTEPPIKSNNVSAREQHVTSSTAPKRGTPTEQTPPEKVHQIEEDGRIEVGRLNRELHELMTQEGNGLGSAQKRINSTKAPHTCEGTPYSRQPSKSERRRTSSEHTMEDRSAIIDAHNTFEPSYLSRTPPLKVDTGAFEFDLGLASPGGHSAMSYSAVVKAKNDEASPELTSKKVPVKLTALTKGTSIEGTKDQSPVTPKGTTGKGVSDDSTKEPVGKRDQSRSAPRPPPGFPPLPPQTWGQDKGKGAEIRLTVLNSRQRGKSEEGAGVLGSSPEVEPASWRGRHGSGDPPHPEGHGSRDREGGSQTRGWWRGGRGGGAVRGDMENRSWRESNDQNRATDQNWENKSRNPGSMSWRDRTDGEEEKSQAYHKEVPVSKGGFVEPRDFNRVVRRPDPSTGAGYGGGFNEESSKPKAQPVRRPFGPGGRKGCYNCGSKDHFECNDRSQMFFD